MSDPHSTLKKRPAREAAAGDAHGVVPGLLLLFAQGRPQSVPMPLRTGQLEIERGDGKNLFPRDMHVSRRHARIRLENGRFQVQDLGSENGTSVNGVTVPGQTSAADQALVRAGDTLFLLCQDLRPHQLFPVGVADGRVVGPLWHGIEAHLARAARFGTTLYITGETGVGKEGVARAFHASGPQGQGPFISVNCAALPQSLAERMLFGCKRGAFSGAVADSDGYLQAADGGTLFLDEVAELDLAVQAKLLRALETREVCQLGSTRARAIKLHLCAASNKDLRAEVGAGRFRSDLFFRLSRPEIELPPLRRRLDEVPWLIDLELQRIVPTLRASASLVEACLLRHWPGNIRELLLEIRAAAQLALNEHVIELHHLSATAGVEFGAPPDLPPPDLPPPASEPAGDPTSEQLAEVLRRTAGNVSSAARLLGIDRSYLRRLMARLGIDGTQFVPEADAAAASATKAGQPPTKAGRSG